MINSLYVHIPFCVKKCLYCDFNSYANRELEDLYIDSLVNEIGKIEQNKFGTIFIGGGTPTILSISNLEKLLKSLKAFSPDEYTIEANPGTIDDEKLKLLKHYGVNRISMGLQAWQDRLLKGLGRIHTIEDFLKSYNLIRKNGFKNVNIDLMFDIPDQSFEDWKETIENVILLKPEHLSCYSLIIEEGTPFYNLYEKGKLNLVDEVDERKMYYYAIERMEKEGLKQYEISNFSREGYECKHNITYWMDEKYIGVGAGAHSYVDNTRYNNFRDIKKYIDGINNGSAVEEKNIVSFNDEISEFMFMGLRMTDGISKKRFKSRFRSDIKEIYSDELNKCIKEGLIEENKECIRLTKRGTDLSNQVFIAFLRE